VGREDGIHDLPGSLDRVLPGEERAVTGHGIAEQPLVGRLLVWLGVEQQQLALFPDELLARALDARARAVAASG